MRLRCFIAMAAGKDDTDRLYKGQIKSTLRRHQVTPVLVEQQEHNDDIDDRIISELKTCDFAIADLTYARPSVYFEAGFAQRKVPVVYTCRSDHFKHRSDDVPEHYRIHFDLQMKNIIRWSSPSDKIFAKRLSKRLALVVRPLIAFRKKQDREREDADAFNALPMKERIKSVLDASVSGLKRHRYSGRYLDSKPFNSWYLFEALREYESGRDRGMSRVKNSSSLWKLWHLHNGWVGSKLEKRTIRTAAVLVTDSLTKKELEDLRLSLFEAPAYDISSMVYAVNIIRNMREHFFLCSLARVPANRVESCLQDFRPVGSGKEFIRSAQQPSPSRRGVVPYQEVYMAGNLREPVCLLHNPSRRRGGSELKSRLVTEDDQPGITLTDDRYMDFHSVDRHVHVHIIDGIKSLESFKDGFSKTLRETEA